MSTPFPPIEPQGGSHLWSRYLRAGITAADARPDEVGEVIGVGGRLDPASVLTAYRLGVLVVRTGTRFAPHHPPSPHEGGHALDPVDVPAALAAAEAWQQVASSRGEDAPPEHELIARIRSAASGIPAVDVVGDPDDRLPHVCTFSVLYVDGETIVDELSRHGIAVGSGSACTSDTLEPSHVLAAMGALTQGNVRITLPLAAVSPDREADVERLCTLLPDVVRECRERLGITDL